MTTQQARKRALSLARTPEEKADIMTALDADQRLIETRVDPNGELRYRLTDAGRNVAASQSFNKFVADKSSADK